MAEQQQHNMVDYDEAYANFRIEVPEHYNFGFDVIDAWARRDRNKLAMIWTDQQGGERKYTFWDLMSLSNAAANILLNYGIHKGDRVMLMLHRVPEWWILTIALTKLGAVVSPSPTMLTAKDIRYRVDLAQFKMVITDLENAPKVDEVYSECASLMSRLVVDGERDGWISLPQEMTYPAPVSHKIVKLPGMARTKATDPMIIFFTSGTTGEPKMVLHDQSYPLGHMVTAGLWHDLRHNDLHFTFSDTGWAKSAWGKIFGQWIAGAAIFVYDVRGKFKATELLPLLERYAITTFCCPPTIYRMLILADLDRFDFTELRHCTSAGEPLNPEVIRAWKEATGTTIYEGYGQTETVLCIGTFPPMEVKQGSMGKPAPGWIVELHDDDGRPVGVGKEGRIAIKTEPRPVGLFREYPRLGGGERAGVPGRLVLHGRQGLRGRRRLLLVHRPRRRRDQVVGLPDRAIRGRVGPDRAPGRAGGGRGGLARRDPRARGQGVRGADARVQTVGVARARHPDPRQEVDGAVQYPRLIEFVDTLPKTISGKIKRNELRDAELRKFQNGNNEKP